MVSRRFLVYDCKPSKITPHQSSYSSHAKWHLPEVFTDIVDFRIDPTWHEFESAEYTDEMANAGMLLVGFMGIIEKSIGD